MALNNPITVRLEEEIRHRLEDAAARSGLKSADLIRMAVSEWLDRVEAAGHVHIPLNLADKPTRYRAKGKVKPPKPT